MKKSNKEKKDQKKKNPIMDDLEESLGTEIKRKVNDLGLIFVLIFIIFLSVYFQYRHEMRKRQSTLSEDYEIDHYEVLGVDSGADLKEIKKKYKELAKIWHPDKNINCKNCHEKFTQISKAYEYLSSEAQKDQQDTKGSKTAFKSSTFLTVKNFHHLVEESNDYWVILIYENTRGNRFNQYISEVWEEVSSKYKHTVRFGVIDVLKGENILHFLPFKFKFYPNIFTIHHGEDSELFQNIDSYNVKTLTQFIDSSFATKINLVDGSLLKEIVGSQKTEKDMTNQLVKYEDLDIKVIVVSSKYNIDLETKEFDKNYHQIIGTYQNNFGSFNQAIEILKSKTNTRVFVSYNDILIEKQDKENKITLKKMLEPIPVIFNAKSPTGPKLQKAFNIIKSLALQRIYKNSYSSHCVDRILIDDEEISKKEQTGETKLNLCVIMLEHPKDLLENPINANFYKILVDNFQRKISNDEKIEKSNHEEYDININYGITSLEGNKEIKKLLANYSETKNINFNEEKFKLFLIIDDTHEKFTFKAFTDDGSLYDFLTDLNHSDFYEDISFSFDYLSNYNVREIKELFVEEKIFSLEKIIGKAFYAQMQPIYIFTFILMFILNSFYFKRPYLTPILLGCSIMIQFIWQLLYSFNIL